MIDYTVTTDITMAPMSEAVVSALEMLERSRDVRRRWIMTRPQ